MLIVYKCLNCSVFGWHNIYNLLWRNKLQWTEKRFTETKDIERKEEEIKLSASSAKGNYPCLVKIENC